MVVDDVYGDDNGDGVDDVDVNSDIDDDDNDNDFSQEYWSNPLFGWGDFFVTAEGLQTGPVYGTFIFLVFFNLKLSYSWYMPIFIILVQTGPVYELSYSWYFDEPSPKIV